MFCYKHCNESWLTPPECASHTHTCTLVPSAALMGFPSGIKSQGAAVCCLCNISKNWRQVPKAAKLSFFFLSTIHRWIWREKDTNKYLVTFCRDVPHDRGGRYLSVTLSESNRRIFMFSFFCAGQAWCVAAPILFLQRPPAPSPCAKLKDGNKGAVPTNRGPGAHT